MKKILTIALILALCALPMTAQAATKSTCTSQSGTCTTATGCKTGNCPTSTRNGGTCAGAKCPGTNCDGSNCASNPSCAGANCSASNCTTGNCKTGSCKTSSTSCKTGNCKTSSTSSTSCKTGNCKTGSGKTSTSSTRNVSGTSMSAMASEVVRQTNMERAKQGLPALSVDSELTSAACVRAQEIVGKFSHTRPNGKRGVTASSQARGENIAKGQQTADKVMAAWMSSSGHRATILRTTVSKIGVCAYQVNGIMYWVQLFA